MSEGGKNLKKLHLFTLYILCVLSVSLPHSLHYKKHNRMLICLSEDFRNISSLLLQEHLEVFHISSVEPYHAIFTFPF